jgi:hypothetical protein
MRGLFALLKFRKQANVSSILVASGIVRKQVLDRLDAQATVGVGADLSYAVQLLNICGQSAHLPFYNTY